MSSFQCRLNDSTGNKKCLDQIRSVEARAGKHLQYILSYSCIYSTMCKRRVFTNISYFHTSILDIRIYYKKRYWVCLSVCLSFRPQFGIFRYFIMFLFPVNSRHFGSFWLILECILNLWGFGIFGTLEYLEI